LYTRNKEDRRKGRKGKWDVHQAQHNHSHHTSLLTSATRQATDHPTAHNPTRVAIWTLLSLTPYITKTTRAPDTSSFHFPNPLFLSSASLSTKTSLSQHHLRKRYPSHARPLFLVSLLFCFRSLLCFIFCFGRRTRGQKLLQLLNHD